MLALLFTVPPLLRPVKPKKSTISRDELNAEVIKTQLLELKADLESGKLDAAQYDSARADLERELLYDIGPPEGQSDNFAHRSGRWAVLVLVLVIPLGAVLLYQNIGSVELIDMPQRAASQAPMDRETAQHSLEEMVTQLEARLEKEPDSAQGWVLLAKSYTATKRFGDAASAYERVYRLGGYNHPEILTDYADVLAMSNGGQFTEKSGGLLERALELDSGSIKTLWLAGHWKYDVGDYPAAIDFWQKTAAQLPPDGEDATVIRQQINEAQSKLGIEATPVTPPAMAAKTVTDSNEATATKASLTVDVQLDSELKNSVSPDDTLFIYARAASGPRMPLAIVRKQARDLPVTVVLDDSMAMSPAMVLSNFEEVTVEARISKSGNAITQSGDFRGTLTPVKVNAGETVKIIIIKAVP